MSTGSQRPLVDRRAWRDLLIVTIIAFATIHRWPKLAWGWGGAVVLLFLRAGSYVLAARAAGADPEEQLQKKESGD